MSRRLRVAVALAAATAAALVLAVLLVDGDDGPAARAPSGEYVRSVSDASAVLWAVGDADATAGGRAVARQLARRPFDRLLYLGDVYESGTAKEFRERYDAILGRFARRTAPTPGNHEWGRRETGYDPYWRRVHGSPPPAYYAFRAGGWRILALNTEAPHGERSAQVRWLRRQVRRPGTCRIAFWHHPRYSAGRHGDQKHADALWDALRGRAALVLSGHDHDLQRLEPIDGITQIVSGAGGRELRTVDEDDPRLAFSSDQDYGAVRLALRPGRAVVSFVAADGRVLDRSSVSCRR